ncbi:ECF transporter S component [Acholeplasma hippikon]|uniref:Protein of uncharacterized function (DUF3816) n=1 Tax=Acholeplasma hippikon TaxID=264636 RepID=A0A449BJG2_9MOLU|nr:ECF transporter S component [Acholeplasma hippikon]VEU82604.1 Protein of uncharacterised function (DUF3816) [Acholeplasma hippikon]
MSQNQLALKKMIYLVTLTAISIVLGLFEIPLGLPWLKIDLSEIVILLSVIIIGPKETFVVILFRGFFRQFLQGEILILDQVFGELVAVVASSTLVLSYLAIGKLTGRLHKPMLEECIVDNTRMKFKEYLLFIVGMTLALSTVMILLNIFFITPIYISIYMYYYPGAAASTLSQFHFSIFTLIKDPGMSNVFGADLSNMSAYLAYIIGNYALLNVAKGILTSVIFLPAKERIEKMKII